MNNDDGSATLNLLKAALLPEWRETFKKLDDKRRELERDSDDIKISIEEVLELVNFIRDSEGRLRISNVHGDVGGSVVGSVVGSVYGDVKGDVKGESDE